MFREFCVTLFGTEIEPPISAEIICLFVAHLHNSNKAPRTISTYISAIGFIHKILNVPDPSNSFLVSKLISGAYRVKPSFDIRLPITMQILDKLIFESSLFKAMYLFTFYTFARIGELTGHDATAYHVIQFGDVSFSGSSPHQSATVTFRKYKHNTTGIPHMISFSRGQSVHDPVQALLDYI